MSLSTGMFQQYRTRILAAIRHGRGLTLLQLIQSTRKYEAMHNAKIPRKDLKTSISVQRGLIRVNVPETLDSFRVRAVALSSDRTKKYPLYIDFLQEGGYKKVNLACGCMDHWGRFNYANYLAGVSFQHKSSGSPENSKNPQHVPGCCKHIQQLVMMLVQEGYITRNLSLDSDYAKVVDSTIAQYKKKRAKRSPVDYGEGMSEVFQGNPNSYAA